MNNYLAYRNELKNGDILAWTPNGLKGTGDLIPYIIKYATGSDFYHVGQVWRVGERIFVVEAMPPLVRIYPLSRKPSFFHIPMNVQWNEEKENGLLSSVGDDYSLIKAMLTIFKKPTIDNSWQCALKVGQWFEVYENIKLSDTYTPSDLVKNAIKISDKIVYVNV